MRKTMTLIGMLGLPLAACGEGSTGPAAASPALPAMPPAATRTPAPDATTADVRVRSQLAAMVEAALAAAAEKTGVPRSDLKVVSSASVVWADGSIGCPEPGMSYTMALVPGYRIIIDAHGETLDYHATGRGYLILCPPGRSVEPTGEEIM